MRDLRGFNSYSGGITVLGHGKGLGFDDHELKPAGPTSPTNVGTQADAKF